MLHLLDFLGGVEERFDEVAVHLVADVLLNRRAVEVIAEIDDATRAIPHLLLDGVQDQLPGFQTVTPGFSLQRTDSIEQRRGKASVPDSDTPAIPDCRLFYSNVELHRPGEYPTDLLRLALPLRDTNSS